MPSKRGIQIPGEAGIGSSSKAASGRYGRAIDLGPGVRFWATGRGRQDWMGLQFRDADGHSALDSIRGELVACGGVYYHSEKNDEAMRIRKGGTIEYVWPVSEIAGPLDLERARLVQRACERVVDLVG